MIDEKQVREADAAVTQAVTTFVSEFELMWGRWENVAPGYVIESTLLDFWPPISRPSQDRRRRTPGRLPGLRSRDRCRRYLRLTTSEVPVAQTRRSAPRSRTSDVVL